MTRYALAIDLDLCIGCNACTLACKAEHGTQPGVFWCYVVEKEYGRLPDVTRLFLPVLCNHCDNLPCEAACPTGATYVDEEGVVLVDYDKCIGCRACTVACPYHSRTYIEHEQHYFPGTPIPYAVDELRGHSGVVQKCTLCKERLEQGLVPACVEVCPTSCRVFGDLEDPESEVAQLKGSPRSFRLLPEKGTEPRVFYLSSRVASAEAEARPGARVAAAVPAGSRNQAAG